jgi:hypothetical protein
MPLLHSMVYALGLSLIQHDQWFYEGIPIRLMIVYDYFNAPLCTIEDIKPEIGISRSDPRSGVPNPITILVLNFDNIPWSGNNVVSGRPPQLEETIPAP